MTMNLQSEKFYGLSWAMLRQVCLSQQETVQRLPGSLYSEGEERKGTPRETGMEWRLRCRVISLSSPVASRSGRSEGQQWLGVLQPQAQSYQQPADAGGRSAGNAKQAGSQRLMVCSMELCLKQLDV